MDLLSTPPQGNIVQTAAAAAREPFKQLFKDIDEERATKFATDADLFKTLIEAKGRSTSGTSGKTYS